MIASPSVVQIRKTQEPGTRYSSVSDTKLEKCLALQDFKERYPDFETRMPSMPDRVIQIFKTDGNNKRNLRNTRIDDQKGMNLLLDEEHSVADRLNKAIAHLESKNQRLKNLINIQICRAKSLQIN